MTKFKLMADERSFDWSPALLPLKYDCRMNVQSYLNHQYIKVHVVGNKEIMPRRLECNIYRHCCTHLKNHQQDVAIIL